MKTVTRFVPSVIQFRQRERGTVLLVTLIFAIAIAMSLIGYIRVTNSSLKLSQRTFFANAASNLAEAGLEEAVWSFNKLGNKTDVATVEAVWADWQRGHSVADIYVDYIGSGYTSEPTVSFVGGGGSGATAKAEIATYEVIDKATKTTKNVTSVSRIIITNPGKDYTTAPSVVLKDGGGTGAIASARLAATRTITFNNLDQGGTGKVQVWVSGYDGSPVVPYVVAKATITTPGESMPVEKYIKVILSKNGVLPKGVVAKKGIVWNGKPLADSYLSSVVPGLPPFSDYTEGFARKNTTVASLTGEISFNGGTLNGNLMYGAAVTLSIKKGVNITGSTIPNFDYNFAMPTYPANAGTTAGTHLGNALPAVLPLPADKAARDADVLAGKAKDETPYYYYVSKAVIGDTTITPGTNVVIVGDGNTQLRSGFKVPTSGAAPWKAGSAKIYMDGDIVLKGDESVNVVGGLSTSWAGALEVYTTFAGDLTISGNADFVGCIFAPDARLVGNGGGADRNDLIGSFVVGSVTDNGHMYFHFDEALKNSDNPKPWQLSLWTELHTAEDRAIYKDKFNF